MNKKNIWLVQEKRTEARDNGYHLFKYIREQHPEVNAYYVITEDSADIGKIKPYGNIINADSLKHYVYYLAAKNSIGSQPNGASPYPTDWVYRFRKLCIKDQNVIFLQHGMIKDKLPGLAYEKTNFQLFVCSSRGEYDYVRSDLHYPEENAQILGLCRFDNLWKDTEPDRTVLIMPTFRKYLVSENREKDSKEQEDNIFKESEFYIQYRSLLTDKHLLSTAKEQGYNIVFYLHYSLQSFSHVFKDCENEIVKVAERKEYDVQKLLMDSSILVTDFSSVFFDFAYMNKPEAFFQFDEEEYRNGHYKEGYFDYRRDAFGPVIKDKDELVSYLIDLINAGGTIEPEYLDRINAFFTIRDNHNCERTYKAIESLG